MDTDQHTWHMIDIIQYDIQVLSTSGFHLSIQLRTSFIRAYCVIIVYGDNPLTNTNVGTHQGAFNINFQMPH